MSSEQEPSVAVSSTAPVSAVSIEIPPFWSNDPGLWFSQVEAQFTLKGITSQLTKFHYIVASLEPQIALHVRPFILNPPASNLYDTLKLLLLQSFTPSQQSRLQQVFIADSLGDMKPTEYRSSSIFRNYSVSPPQMSHFSETFSSYVYLLLSARH